MKTLPRIHSSDLKLLRVFQAVAEAGSYAGAQSRLNVSASTISTHMSALEARFGVRLCTRGRTGFRLTEAGRRILDASRRLFAAHEQFTYEIGSTRQRERKLLRIAVVDNVILNRELRISEALRQLCGEHGPIEIHISTLSPSEVEQGVLHSEFDIGIGVFFHAIPGLTYVNFLRTEQVLCCGVGHPFFERPCDDVSIAEISDTPYVTRSYLGQRIIVSGIDFRAMADTQSIEATAMLVLTGHYIAHLPKYYIERWISSGEMRVIHEKKLCYSNDFGYTLRKSGNENQLAVSFSKLLVNFHRPSPGNAEEWPAAHGDRLAQ